MKKTVLLLERDRDLLEYLRGFYYRDDWDVVTASTRSAVFQILQSSRIDLVVGNLMTLQDDAMELLLLIRSYSEVAILFLSPQENNPNFVVQEHDADEYLKIPFKPGELRARSHALSVRRPRVWSAAVRSGPDSARTILPQNALTIMIGLAFKDFASRIRATMR